MIEAEILSGLHEHIRTHFYAKLSIDRVGRNFGCACERDLAIVQMVVQNLILMFSEKLFVRLRRKTRKFVR